MKVACLSTHEGTRVFVRSNGMYRAIGDREPSDMSASCGIDADLVVSTSDSAAYAINRKYRERLLILRYPVGYAGDRRGLHKTIHFSETIRAE
ncbi:hypothetical protein LTR37_006998 [Vermiconidia calcicola]|uniref:Uncharacterized protein n=1 Tax=Vermiconidia calcicola TaxID=1690605 RepID=A0ACC3NES7_9PEZI|nr:hypothetical protein LTR37_006998 [Vermiconidia calcicola]